MFYLIVEEEPERRTKWAEADTLENLKGVCQFFIDSARTEGLKDFSIWAVTRDNIDKTSFFTFCEKHGITKKGRS